MKTLEERYAESARVLRNRYRIGLISLVTAFLLFFPVSVVLDNIFPQTLIIPLILIYFAIFIAPGLFFATSRCPKCRKALMFPVGAIFKKYANFPNKCMHCGFRLF